MARRTRDLLPASWKGIPFFVRSEVQTEGGRRIVLHDYPNSSERFVEDLGQLPQQFQITAFVTGADFLDRADQLEKALQEEGAGRLVMPTFGSATLFAMPYRKDASQTEVGEIRFELSFVAGKAISGPREAPITIESVYTLGDIVRSIMSLKLADLWLIPISAANSLVAQFDLTSFANAVGQAITFVNNAVDLAGDIAYIVMNAPSIVKSIIDLPRAFIEGLWQTLSVGLTGGKGLSVLTTLTQFGGGQSLSLSEIRSATVPMDVDAETADSMVPLWDETTRERQIRNRNRLTIINTGRVLALVTAYEQAAAGSYRTDAEIEEVRQTLEAIHAQLMRIDTSDPDIPQSDPEVRQAVENVRLAALDLLDQKAQAAYSLTAISVEAPLSVFCLSYDLYAEELTTGSDVTSRAMEIRGLNPGMASDKLDGNITVLQK